MRIKLGFMQTIAFISGVCVCIDIGMYFYNGTPFNNSNLIINVISIGFLEVFKKLNIDDSFINFQIGKNKKDKKW